MRPKIEPIEIQDPKIGEIVAHRSCLKIGCSTSFFGILLFIVGAIILFRTVIIARPETMKTIPDSFPKDIPIYDKDTITSIHRLTGDKKARALALIHNAPGFLQKEIESTVRNRFAPEIEDFSFTTTTTPLPWTDFLRTLESSSTQNQETIRIEWRDLHADPSFIETYYTNVLERAGYTLLTLKTDNLIQVRFSKNTLIGTLVIKDTSRGTGTDFFSITLNNIPTEK